VQLDTSSTGTKSGQISFTDNDSDENPFSFSITGTVTNNIDPGDHGVGQRLSTSPTATRRQAAPTALILAARCWVDRRSNALHRRQLGTGALSLGTPTSFWIYPHRGTGIIDSGW